MVKPIITIKTPKDRIDEIVDEMILNETTWDRVYFKALKEMLGDTHSLGLLRVARNAVHLTADAMGFHYDDVVEEIAINYIKQKATRQYYNEIKADEKATIAMGKVGRSIPQSLRFIEEYGSKRKSANIKINISKLDEELIPIDTLPWENDKTN